MAEDSRPWPGVNIGDHGPFSAVDWFDVWGAMSAASVADGDSDNYNIGVFYSILNALVPTISGTDIDVDTGASLIDGLYHKNDAAVSVPITIATTTRTDYIVVRKNYQSAITYTPAGGAPTVGPYEARVTVIRGVDGGGTPSLTQDTTRTTYWDIPIATIDVDNAGVLSNLVDAREFADVETKYLFLQAASGYNATDLTNVYYVLTLNYMQPAIILQVAKVSDMFAFWTIPDDYISGLNAQGVVGGLTTGGNIYVNMTIQGGSCGELITTNSESLGLVAQPIETASRFSLSCHASFSPTTLNETPGDIMRFIFERSGTNVLDTLGFNAHFIGFRVSYLGWK